MKLIVRMVCCRTSWRATLLKQLQPEPAGAAARTEMLLVGAQRDRRFIIGADGVIGIGEKVHIDATDPSGAEFDIARARSGVSDWNLLVPQARNQRPGDRARGALREDAGFRRALSRAVADGVNVGEARLERLGLDRHIAVLGHAAILKQLRGTA